MTLIDAPFPRPHFGATVTGGTNTALHKQLMREWYGLNPVRGDGWWDWAVCPHRLTGRKCSDPMKCALTKEHRTGCGVWDHARAWRANGGDLIYTLEPYGNPYDHTEDFAELERDLARIGVVTAFEGRSPYGASYIIFVAHEKTPLGARFARASRWRRDVANDALGLTAAGM